MQSLTKTVITKLTMNRGRPGIRGLFEKRKTAEKTADIVHFAHDVLAVNLTDHQAQMVADIVNSPEALRLEVSGRRWGKTEAMRIATEYRRINP